MADSTVQALIETYREQLTLRPISLSRHEPGDELSFEVKGVAPARTARLRLRVLRFVGGGFAGQVYRVEVLEIDAEGKPPAGLVRGRCYAMKILRPASRFGEAFRNLLYGVGFQSAFSPQANPHASRAGALWQKMIRRGARVRLGDERAVVDIHATFVDPVLGSCGEISEWVEGRVWRFEVDDRLFSRGGSAEYVAKRRFMADLVRLLKEMGAPELARQYEWWSLKSQPNCLKRLEAGDRPAAGLTAVDFRAGLALLPCLPMSPVDFRLIAAGLLRGSPVQFDRGDVGRLRRFAEAHFEAFKDLGEALDELEKEDRAYREGQVDVTHHHFRLLRPRLWRSIRRTAVAGWRLRGLTDERTSASLERNSLFTLLFTLVGLLPVAGLAGAVALLFRPGPWYATAGWMFASLLAGRIAGRTIRRIWGRADHRAHLLRILARPRYLARAFRARAAERLIDWYRAGRVSGERARRLASRPLRMVGHLPLSVLPAFLHRMLTDGAFLKERLVYLFVRPFRLYFHAAEREEWLREMIEDGRRRRMLTDEEADRVIARIGEPFIQKYLKSLAVHVLTLPVTQIVSVLVAIWYVKAHPDLTWEQATAHAGLILAAFQIAPVSPGSLVRGLYVVWLVVKERNLADYHIAVFLAFFKYVGYLAFPIQMAYRYPALARFMAAYWATGAVHFIPVFGEHGALLEHLAFDTVYNYPLTLRRRMRERAVARAKRPPRRWHALPLAAAGVGALVAADSLLRSFGGAPPGLGELWPFLLLVPVLIGIFVTLLAGGSSLGARVRLAIGTGAVTGAVSSFVHSARAGAVATDLLVHLGWSLLLFTLLATLAALLTEIHLPGVSPEPATR